MTAIGHSLTGLSIGVLCMPTRWSRPAKAAWLVLMAALACVPDIPLPHWGHNDYRVSHSLASNVVLLLVVGGAVWLALGRRRRRQGRVLLLGGAGAWLSHLTLDAMYNHGRGVGIGWPLGRWKLKLTLPWFATLDGQWRWDWYSVRIALIELAFYGTLLAGCVALRRIITGRRRAAGTRAPAAGSQRVQPRQQPDRPGQHGRAGQGHQHLAPSGDRPVVRPEE